MSDDDICRCICVWDYVVRVADNNIIQNSSGWTLIAKFWFLYTFYILRIKCQARLRKSCRILALEKFLSTYKAVRPILYNRLLRLQQILQSYEQYKTQNYELQMTAQLTLTSNIYTTKHAITTTHKHIKLYLYSFSYKSIQHLDKRISNLHQQLHIHYAHKKRTKCYTLWYIYDTLSHIRAGGSIATTSHPSSTQSKYIIIPSIIPTQSRFLRIHHHSLCSTRYTSTHITLHRYITIAHTLLYIGT